MRSLEARVCARLSALREASALSRRAVVCSYGLRGDWTTDSERERVCLSCVAAGRAQTGRRGRGCAVRGLGGPSEGVWGHAAHGHGAHGGLPHSREAQSVMLKTRTGYRFTRIRRLTPCLRAPSSWGGGRASTTKLGRTGGGRCVGFDGPPEAASPSWTGQRLRGGAVSQNAQLLPKSPRRRALLLLRVRGH